MVKNTNKHIIWVFVVSGVCAFLFFIIVNYLVNLLHPSHVAFLMILIVSSVLLAALITFAVSILTPIFSETMTTLRRMLRIESLSHPLIMKLSSEAPGTYHHSLNVSTLAQKVAKEIGADSLLVRTAAYYHDIGKLSNPLFYIENQSGVEIEKREDAQSIRKNAKIIIAHVKEGLKIAKEYKLPDEVINLIREHHGTTRALYFYRIAKERGLKIKKTDFRYDGPVPQSKESAILMLADCTEATLRAYDNLTPEIIHDVVKNAILERLSDNQFKNSGLSESEFARIRVILGKILLSIYHQRIEYKHDKG